MATFADLRAKQAQYQTFSNKEDETNHKETEKQQKEFNYFLCYFGIIQVIAVALVVTTIIWGYFYLNGYAWTPALVFNFHPVFMIITICLYGDSMLMYRLLNSRPKAYVKLLHASIHVLAFIFALLGLVAVFNAHNWNGMFNLYSLHSWLGLTTVILFSMQWICGFAFFLVRSELISETLKAAYLKLHKIWGATIFIFAIVAALMGLTEKITKFYDGNYVAAQARSICGNVIGVLLIVFGTLVVMEILKPKKPVPLPTVTILPSADIEQSTIPTPGQYWTM